MSDFEHNLSDKQTNYSPNGLFNTSSDLVDSSADSLETNDFEDETLEERLLGLFEMFPQSVRSNVLHISSVGAVGVSKLYGFMRTTVWVTVTSTIILLTPLAIHLEGIADELNEW